METIYESREEFPIHAKPAAAIQTLRTHLNSAGYKVNVEGARVTVQTGSNFFLRMWGTMLPWGRQSVPVGMTVEFNEATIGSTVKIHTYDMLGWYLDRNTNLVVKEECQEKMALLSNLAHKALPQRPNRLRGASPKPPS